MNVKYFLIPKGTERAGARLGVEQLLLPPTRWEAKLKLDGGNEGDRGYYVIVRKKIEAKAPQLKRKLKELQDTLDKALASPAFHREATAVLVTQRAIGINMHNRLTFTGLPKKHNYLSR